MQTSQRSATDLYLDLVRKLGSYEKSAEQEIKDAGIRGNVGLVA